MFPEILLGTVLVIAGGTFTYLWRDHRRGKLALREEQANADRQFRDALPRELRRADLRSFDYGEFVERCGASLEAAVGAAEEVYTRTMREVMADCVVDQVERARLDALTTALAIPVARAQAIEDRARADAEAARANRQRKAVTDVLDDYIGMLRAIVRRGRCNTQDRSVLTQIKEAFSRTDGRSISLPKDHAMAIYRECLTNVIQDGDVLPAQESLLDWLQGEVGLSDGEVRTHRGSITLAKTLASYRRGELPAITTNKLLEGGESCHYLGRCDHGYRTTKRYLSASGELLVTSKRIVFTSPAKTIKYSPSKILNIELTSWGVEIQTESAQGNGTYVVNDPAALEAILFGLVRTHKYLLAENYASAKSRHIPDDVKRAVWDRDGGRCVKCSAVDYLEYDHDIPFSRGGASTLGNLRILCRRCNGQKGDRI